MRRKAWFRSLAALLAIWLPLIVGEPGVAHACPTHGAAATASTVSSHHGAHGAGNPRHGAASHGSASQHGSPTHGHHDCSCISCCVGSAAAPAPAPAPTTTFVVAVHAADATYSPAPLPRSTAEYSRPYTTGPPRV